jgi:excisionase family DNA binding protein
MPTNLESAFRAMLKEVVVEALKEFVPSQSKSSQQMTDSHINTSPSLLRVRDAARLLQVSERTLWNLTDNGNIPCIHVGRAVRYDPAAIREWISRSQSSRAGQMDRVESGEPKPAGARPKAPTAHGDSPVVRFRRLTNQAQPTRVKRQRRRPSATKAAPPPSTTAEGQSRDVFALIASRLGVDRDKLPQCTNGQLMRAADLDIATYHGWVYHGKDLPAGALDKLISFFAAELTRSAHGDTPSRT